MSNQINQKIGILGGGQLGKMLLQETTNLNLHVSVLDPDHHAPAKHLCQSFTQGSFSDENTVLNFGEELDVITIEIEHVHTGALKKLEAQGKKVFPQPHIIELIQDKGLQKRFFEQNNIPTAAFALIESESEIKDLPLHFFPAFQKTRTQGYDGKGVKKIQSPNEPSENCLKGPSVIEKEVEYLIEIAVITAHNGNGEIVTFPVIEMEFNAEANLVERVWMPSRLGVDIQNKAKEIAIRTTQKLGIIGILAVEMFVTHQGEVLVNEIAPRPHNSGHQTIEGCTISQYGMHIRAILGLPLFDAACTLVSCMVNLLGEKGHEGNAQYVGLNELLRIPQVYPHLYGKRITKPFRKMGHVTITGLSHDEVLAKSTLIQQNVKVIAETFG